VRRLAAPVGGVALVAVVLVIVTHGGGSHRSPVPAPAGGPAIGVNASAIFNSATPAAVVERHLAGMERAGVTLVRTDAVWRALEPSAGVYDWTRADAIATGLAAHRIRWWPVLGYAPSWAAAQPGALHSPPNDPATYGRFVGAFAARYGSTGTFWAAHPALPRLPVEDYELWNEPNLRQFWSPAPDPAAYAAAFAAGAGALGVADPAGRAVLGGFAPSRTWVPAVLAAHPEIRTEIGAAGLHPYAVTPAVVVTHVETLRSVLDAAGLPAVPIAVTEVGWETSPPGARWYATDAQRAAFLLDAERALGARPALRVSAYLPYAWSTAEASPATEDDWYGLVPPSGATEDTAGARAIRALTGTGRAP
jgi:hypothetical protein